jgi:exopolysaccharide production protein ExoQ
MRIPKAIFIDPDRNALYGCVAIAVSMFVFAYSTNFGKLPILVYYALWFPLLLVGYRRALGNLLKYYWILPFGILACLSVFWSNAPGVSARAAVQYATHILCALVAARTMNIKTLTRGTLAGVFLVLLYSLAKRTYQFDPFDGDYSFVGAFSSKNQLGFFCTIGIYFAFASLFILGENRAWRIFAVLCGAISAVMLVKAHSATALITIVAALATAIGLSVLAPFSPRIRKILLAVAIVLGAGAVVAALSAGGYDLLLSAFGKNTTLTGRTYLWSQGLAAASRNPMLGVGYQAYWVQGFPDAERLWREFYIASRTGFHFHDTYIETLVELGVVGAILLSIVFIRVEVALLRRFLDDRNDRAARIMFGLIIMLVLRSFVEVDVLTPYVVGSFLLYYAAGLVAVPQAQPAIRRLLEWRASALPASAPSRRISSPRRDAWRP